MTFAVKRAGGVTIGVALVFIVGWFMLVFHPQGKDLTKAHKANADAQAQLGQLQSQEVVLNRILAQKPQDVARYAVLNAALPDDPQLAGAIDQINAAAASSGFALKNVNPAAPAAKAAATTQSAAGVPNVALSINGSGSYQQAISFMTNLTSSSRTFVISSVQFSGGQTNGAPLSVSIACSIYFAR